MTGTGGEELTHSNKKGIFISDATKVESLVASEFRILFLQCRNLLLEIRVRAKR